MPRPVCRNAPILSRLLFARALLCAVLVMPAAATIARAQGMPPPAAASLICQRLIAQLSAIDNGAAGGDSVRADQIRRYEDAAGRQQAELERVQVQARRQGCDSSGFFSLFTGASAQCGPINSQIQQMRANLDQIQSSLERLRGNAPADGDGQRRSVLLALAQNNCGPQYAAAARAAGGASFLENLFGGGGAAPPPGGGDYGAQQSSTFRTVCVRTCDGYYFPISFATVPSRFPDDERTCKAQCPAAEAQLFTYRNPGEDISQAVSISGQPYSQLPNAFRYRQQFDKTCSCKAPGQTWSDALKAIDDREGVAQGDIIVTDERAKKMAQPQPTRAQPAKKTSAATPAAASPPAPAAPAAPAAGDTTASGGDKPIRSVGPTFIPAR